MCPVSCITFKRKYGFTGINQNTYVRDIVKQTEGITHKNYVFDIFNMEIHVLFFKRQ